MCFLPEANRMDVAEEQFLWLVEHYKKHASEQSCAECHRLILVIELLLIPFRR